MQMLKLSQLIKLIKSRRVEGIKLENGASFVCITDVVYEFEKIKKDARAHKILGNIRKKETDLHIAIDEGKVETLNLEKNTIQEGLCEDTLKGKNE